MIDKLFDSQFLVLQIAQHIMVIFSLLLGLLGAIIFLIICRVVTPKTQTRTLAIGLIVAAFIYIAFAILGQASAAWIAVEVAGIAIYGLFAVLGLYCSRWWLMVGWLLHPVWDLWLHFYEPGASFTPAWYVLMCLSFDLVVAAYIGGMQFGLFKLKTVDPLVANNDR